MCSPVICVSASDCRGSGPIHWFILRLKSPISLVEQAWRVKPNRDAGQMKLSDVMRFGRADNLAGMKGATSCWLGVKPWEEHSTIRQLISH